ncbi:DUF417 family protein [Photobacterium leiognathi]|uniref:DUF417 domain-containing protein n=1 Tax=Photobacterium leiognathi TaxID=553611 RepID=A0A2T3M7M8_PHOLE|nr:DUF417 family protein [Photobacterium leiognathi]KJF97413.1 membrane protein [Photobacterium leiognathi]PSV88270.1 DUF417 domain-containing protein [Photobacterium leiognathi]
MSSIERQSSKAATTSFSYKIGVFGVVLLLLWIGIFKFTPTEAAEIEPLVLNHPLMGWLYSVLSVQGVSNLIGISEIIVGVGLAYSFISPKAGVLFGAISSVLSIVTLSFLITTPDTWKMVDGIPTTSFFLVKDILFLAVSLRIVEHNKKFLS